MTEADPWPVGDREWIPNYRVSMAGTASFCWTCMSNRTSGAQQEGRRTGDGRYDSVEQGGRAAGGEGAVAVQEAASRCRAASPVVPMASPTWRQDRCACRA